MYPPSSCAWKREKQITQQDWYEPAGRADQAIVRKAHHPFFLEGNITDRVVSESLVTLSIEKSGCPVLLVPKARKIII